MFSKVVHILHYVPNESLPLINFIFLFLEFEVTEQEIAYLCQARIPSADAEGSREGGENILV